MKLNYKRTVLIGLAFMSISAFWQMYDNEIPKILKNTFGMGETLTGAIMAIDNVLALFLLPIFGTFSDKVNPKVGRRMPFILIGTALACALLVILPIANHTVNLPLFVVGLFFILICMGTYRSPAVALMPDLTPKPLRSKANAVINLMGAVGGVFTLLMIKLLVGKSAPPNYFPLFLSVGALMAISIIVLFFTIKENKLRQEREELEVREGLVEKDEEPTNKNAGQKLPKDVFRSLCFILASVAFWFIAYNAVTTAFSRYGDEVWGLKGGGYANCLLIATVAAIISYIPIGALASKIGRKKTIMIGVALCYFLIFPLTIRFLGNYQVSDDVANIITLSSYIDTLTMLTLMLGIVFELPILCMLLGKMGILTADFMKEYRRHAIVIILIVAAIITPTTDVMTLMLVTLPIYLLYEISILAVKMINK